MASSSDNSSPGPIDSVAPETTGKDKDMAKSLKLRILHIFDLPLESHYGSILEAFKAYGKMSEICMEFSEVDKKWDAWISFEDVFLLIVTFPVS